MLFLLHETLQLLSERNVALLVVVLLQRQLHFYVEICVLLRRFIHVSLFLTLINLSKLKRKPLRLSNILTEYNSAVFHFSYITYRLVRKNGKIERVCCLIKHSDNTLVATSQIEGHLALALATPEQFAWTLKIICRLNLISHVLHQ